MNSQHMNSQKSDVVGHVRGAYCWMVLSNRVSASRAVRRMTRRKLLEVIHVDSCSANWRFSPYLREGK